MTTIRRRFERGAPVAAVVVMAMSIAPIAEARIVKTRRPSVVRPGVEFTLGSGFEYQNDGEQRELGFPALLEWSLTPRLSLTAEPTFIAIRGPGPTTINGWDDLETSLSVELLSERRRRPNLSLSGGAKLPTSSNREIGSGLTDLSLGVLLGKEFVQAETGFELSYSHVGLPDSGLVQNTVQISGVVEWHLTPTLDLTAELLTTQGLGGLRGHAGRASSSGAGLNVPGRGAGEVEATVGLAHYFGRRLKLEEGVVVQTDGTWQAVVAWEWDFGEGR